MGFVWPQVYDFATSEPLPKELISEDVLDSMTLDNGQVVLKPGQTPAPLSGFDKAELSSMGFAADGTFQVLVQLADGGLLESELGRRQSLLLTNVYLDGEMHTGPSEDISFELDGKSYVGIRFSDLHPEDLDKLTLSDAYGTVLMSEPIFGEWEVPFQVENYPVMEMTLTGEAEGTRLLTQLILTPLGAMVRGGVGDGVSRKLPVCGCAQRWLTAGTGSDPSRADESYESLYFGQLGIPGAFEFGRSGGSGAVPVVYPAYRRKRRRRLSLDDHP